MNTKEKTLWLHLKILRNLTWGFTSALYVSMIVISIPDTSSLKDLNSMQCIQTLPFCQDGYLMHESIPNPAGLLYREEILWILHFPSINVWVEKMINRLGILYRLTSFIVIAHFVESLPITEVRNDTQRSAIFYWIAKSLCSGHKFPEI